MAEKNTPEWQKEESKLTEFKTEIQKNIDKLVVKKADIDARTKELYDHYHSSNPELISDLMVSLDMQEQIGETLNRNLLAKDKPYFGRVDFIDESENRDYSIYIGKHGISGDDSRALIIDWRAPVSSVYYESDLGKSSYTAPGGKIPIDLQLKRTFEIEEGKLVDYYDTEVIANDDFLLKYLGKNKEIVLGEIIATIQKEQNDIIRDTPWHNVLVQGVAGSGKTTVAMHRISYILYNYAKRFKPQEFYIIGSNKMLLNYITGVLPDLDVHGVNQMTLEEFFLHLLDRNFILKKSAKKPEQSGALIGFKGSIAYMRVLEEYMDLYEKEKIPQGDVEYEGETYMTADEIRDYILNYRNRSLEEKIDMMNERLAFVIKYKGERNGDESKNIRARQKKLKNYFGKTNQKVSLIEIYIEFIKSLETDSHGLGIGKSELGLLIEAVSSGAVDLYDLCMMAYIKRRLKPAKEYENVKHMVVDEAQDFGAIVFYALKKFLPEATFTVMGDISQNINYYTGMNDWAELRSKVYNGEDDKFYILAKSYRNTIEISEYAGRILSKCSFETYKIDPIIRHGREVEIIEAKNNEECLLKTVEAIEGIRSRGFDTVAVICRTEDEALKVQRELEGKVDLVKNNFESATFSKGVMVLPIALTKGLEFDAVILWEPNKENYGANDAEAKLLYVAVTRALHELYLIGQGGISPLLMDEPKIG